MPGQVAGGVDRREGALTCSVFSRRLRLRFWTGVDTCAGRVPDDGVTAGARGLAPTNRDVAYFDTCLGEITSTTIPSAGHRASVVTILSAPSTRAVATTRASERRSVRPCVARKAAAPAAIAREAGSTRAGRASTNRSVVATASRPRLDGETRHSAYAEAGSTSSSPRSRAAVSASRAWAWCGSPASRTAIRSPASRTVSPTRRAERQDRPARRRR